MNKELAIVLRATGATQTARDVGKVDSSISHLTSRAGTFATKLRGSVSGAVATFSGRIKGLIGASAGVLGVGGLLGLGVLFTNSIRKAQEWGASALRLSQLTKLPIETTSRLIDALDYFGVSAEMQTAIAGKFEKAIGAIAERSAKGATAIANWNKTHKTSITVSQRLALEYPKLAKFQKDYGLSLTDSKGHLLDWNKQLLVSADYFNNKSVPASKKALALSKLYGKSWQDMIPVLAQGRSGILKAEQDAMSMSQGDLDAITKNKEATRAWDDAIGDLQTQIGIKLLPTLTDLMNGASSFINGHADEIVGFVKKAIDVARAAVGTITGVVSALGGLWDKIPAPLRDLLLKGLVADRAMKFLFGISPIQVVTHLAEGAIGSVGSTVAKSLTGTLLGSVQKVWVMNPGLGGGGGPGGAAGGGKGVKGVLGTALSAAVLVEALSYVQDNVNMPNAQAQAGKNIQGTEAIIGRGNAGEISSALQGVQASVASLSGLQKVMYDLNANGVKTHTEGLEAALQSALQDALKGTERNLQPMPALSQKQQRKLDTLRDRIESSRIATVTRLGTVKSAIDTARINQIAAQRTGDASIVAAIKGIHISNPITIISNRTGTYVKTGTTLRRVGGAVAEGNLT